MSTLLFTDEPARAAARQLFDALPMPGRTDETWRFANYKALDLTPFSKSPAPFSGDRDRLLNAPTALPG